jgi:hypothetical protein
MPGLPSTNLTRECTNVRALIRVFAIPFADGCLDRRRRIGIPMPPVF